MLIINRRHPSSAAHEVTTTAAAVNSRVSGIDLWSLSLTYFFAFSMTFSSKKRLKKSLKSVCDTWLITFYRFPMQIRARECRSISISNFFLQSPLLSPNISTDDATLLFRECREEHPISCGRWHHWQAQLLLYDGHYYRYFIIYIYWFWVDRGVLVALSGPILNQFRKLSSRLQL